MTPDGTEAATFRFVAQHLNHCATVATQTTQLLTLQLTLKKYISIVPASTLRPP